MCARLRRLLQQVWDSRGLACGLVGLAFCVGGGRGAAARAQCGLSFARKPVHWGIKLAY